MTENPCIGFIGLGLIGGSLAKSIRRAFPLASLYAFDQNRENTRLALHEGVINRICTEKDPAFGECDYIFLCTPVKNNITYLPFLRDIRKAGCIISDVGSVKGEMHRAVTDAGMENCFIGGHPMAGSEKSGYENATDFLMENAYYLITPAGEVDVMRLAEFMELITAIRAIPMVMTFEEHDYVTAAVSHLPHIVAASLVNAIRNLDTSDQCMKQIAAGGFRDITRIASSSPVMWQQICLSNGPAISRVLDEYIKLLVQARCFVDNQDEEALYQIFRSSREYRDALPESAKGPLQKVYVIYCDIYDEAGGIATIATLLAMNSISMKNIGIVHNREFEEGVLRIEFYEEDAREKAAKILTERNYTIHQR